MRWGYLMMCLHGNMTVDLGMGALRTMMQVKSTSGWRWLWVVIGHERAKGNKGDGMMRGNDLRPDERWRLNDGLHNSGITNDGGFCSFFEAGSGRQAKRGKYHDLIKN